LIIEGEARQIVDIDGWPGEPAMPGGRLTVMAAQPLPRRHDAVAVLSRSATLVVAVTAALAVAGCATATDMPQGARATASPPAPSTLPGADRRSIASSPQPSIPTRSSQAAGIEVHVRTVGPDQAGTQIVIRFGDLLTVTPPTRAQGWLVGDYPKQILQLHRDARAAASHSFTAIAVGQGQLTLTAAGPAGTTADSFTIRIRVLRDAAKGQP
jgi:hypothetical protein